MEIKIIGRLDALMDQMKQVNCVPPGSARKVSGNVGLMNAFQRSMFVMDMTGVGDLDARMIQMSQRKCVPRGSVVKGSGNVALTNVSG